MHRRIKHGIFKNLFTAKAFELVLLTDAYLINLKGQPSKFVELKLYIQHRILLTKQLQLMIITLHLKWIPLLADAEEF